MRSEIKFRGKTAKGKWVYGNLLNEQTIGEVGNNLSHYKFATVIPETVGQLHNFLTYKAGKEVYVGDKIRYDLSAGLGQPARICQEGVVSNIEFDYSYYTNIRVLGSIHDKESEATNA